MYRLEKLLALIIDTACEEVELRRAIARLIALLILLQSRHDPRIIIIHVTSAARKFILVIARDWSPKVDVSRRVSRMKCVMRYIFVFFSLSHCALAHSAFTLPHKNR